MAREPSDTPGLEITLRGGKRVPRWRARKSAILLGYRPSTVRLYVDPNDHAELAERCQALWRDMEDWLAEARPGVPRFDGTLRSLIAIYTLDPDSPYHALKHSTQEAYQDDMKILTANVGERRLDALTGQDFRRWYGKLKQPVKSGGPERLRRAHGVMTMLRMLLGYGKTLGFPSCDRLRSILEEMKFAVPAARERFLTYEQALAIIAQAHAIGEPEMALAQALQFECMLRQIDVIGEWIPDPDVPGRRRWANGLLWQHISRDYVLEKRTTKRGTPAAVDLREYPLALAEVQRAPPERRVGPVVIDSHTGQPFRSDSAYSRRWRALARAAGVPDDVWNRDSRAGGVTEGSDAGADIEHLRHHASHTSAATTQRYNRRTLEKTTTVARLRVAHRKEKK